MQRPHARHLLLALTLLNVMAFSAIAQDETSYNVTAYGVRSSLKHTCANPTVGSTILPIGAAIDIRNHDYMVGKHMGAPTTATTPTNFTVTPMTRDATSAPIEGCTVLTTLGSGTRGRDTIQLSNAAHFLAPDPMRGIPGTSLTVDGTTYKVAEVLINSAVRVTPNLASTFARAAMSGYNCTTTRRYQAFMIDEAALNTGPTINGGGGWSASTPIVTNTRSGSALNHENWNRLCMDAQPGKNFGLCGCIGNRCTPVLIGVKRGDDYTLAPTTTLASKITLPASTIPVASIAPNPFNAFPVSTPYRVWVGGAIATCTGASASNLTGCGSWSRGGTIAAGATVQQLVDEEAQDLEPGMKYPAVQVCFKDVDGPFGSDIDTNLTNVVRAGACPNAPKNQNLLFQVTGGAGSTTLKIDPPPQMTDRSSTLQIVHNFAPNIRAAIAAACGNRAVFTSSGGTVMVPRGDYPIAQTIDESYCVGLNLIGDGAGELSAATIFHWAGALGGKVFEQNWANSTYNLNFAIEDNTYGSTPGVDFDQDQIGTRAPMATTRNHYRNLWLDSAAEGIRIANGADDNCDLTDIQDVDEFNYDTHPNTRTSNWGSYGLHINSAQALDTNWYRGELQGETNVMLCGANVALHDTTFASDFGGAIAIAHTCRDADPIVIDNGKWEQGYSMIYVDPDATPFKNQTVSIRDLKDSVMYAPSNGIFYRGVATSFALENDRVMTTAPGLGGDIDNGQLYLGANASAFVTGSWFNATSIFAGPGAGYALGNHCLNRSFAWVACKDQYGR